jgi:hypothetical protein
VTVTAAALVATLFAALVLRRVLRWIWRALVATFVVVLVVLFLGHHDVPGIFGQHGETAPLPPTAPGRGTGR